MAGSVDKTHVKICQINNKVFDFDNVFSNRDQKMCGKFL